MGIQAVVDQFARDVTLSRDAEELAASIDSISRAMGFDFFALSHHVDAARVGLGALRLHNYPEEWADYYDRHALGLSDPVHRASHVTCAGFAWSRIPHMIPLTREDQHILAMGREYGIGDGFTVPANVPGEALGSCSFASRGSLTIKAARLPLAQLVGLFAFEGARRLGRLRLDGAPTPCLTDRQRDCLLWVGRGKSDWEISRILDISEETVDRHLKHARERYGVTKRTSVLVRALFDGTLSFSDILK